MRIIGPITAVAALLLPGAVALAADPSWMSDKELVAAARQEGKVVMYSAINEEEELPVLQSFRDATGIAFDYIRGNDAALMSRIMIEARAGKRSWDVAATRIESVPKDLVLSFAPPEVAHIAPEGRDPEGRWFAAYAIIYAPAYNTTKLAAAALPKSYEEFATHREWAGHVAVESTERDWLAGMISVHGDSAGKRLIQDLVATLKPTVYSGHLAMARALGAGEYWLTLTNFVNLTLAAQLSGDPVDFFVLDPVLVGYGEVGANAQAPHSNAAKLLVNFYLSVETQTMRTQWGRVPTRPDVAMNPPGALERFAGHKITRAGVPPEEAGRWQKTFNEWFKN